MADGTVPIEGAAVRKRTRHARPIAIYLFILALVALVPAFTFSAILLERNNQAQERIVESLIAATTRAMASAVERQVDGLATTLKVLSTAETLASEPQIFYQRAVDALAGTNAYLLVLDGEFNQMLNTRVPFGEQRGKSSDPASAERALERGRLTTSDLFFGQTAQRWVFNVLLPLAPEYAPRRLLVLTQNATALSEALASRALPEGWHVALIDGAGRLMASTQGLDLQAGEPLDIEVPPGSGIHDRLVQTKREGAEISAYESGVPGTSWRVVAWAERSVVAKPLADAFWSLLAGGVLLAALVVLVIYAVSLQIGRSVHGLEADAKRLGAGQPVEARSFPIAEIETVSAALGEASRRRQAAETEVRFLMRELAHRSKNQMTVIAAMAKQTARGAETVPEFVQSFERRIFGLARSTDLLLAHGVAGVDLRELLVGQVDPFCPVDGKQVVIEGPPLRLNAQAAQILGMAAHELATNAVKYGAFSREGGRLEVTWKREGDHVRFVWHEIGSAAVAAPPRRGFGTTVLENMVGRSLHGEVRREVHEHGLTWHFAIPLSSLDPSEALNGGDDPATDK